MNHNCQAIIIRCMDFRLEESFESWLKQNNLVNDTDIISIAGSCKEFAANPDGCIPVFLYSQINLSYNKHGARKCILTQHEDCGAYGGQSAFASPEAEKNKLINDMRKTKEIILNKYTDIQVQMYWLKKESENWFWEVVV